MLVREQACAHSKRSFLNSDSMPWGDTFSRPAFPTAAHSVNPARRLTNSGITAAAVRENEPDVGKPTQRPGGHQAQDGARGIHRPLDPGTVHGGPFVGQLLGGAARGIMRMHEHHGTQVVETLINGPEAFVAEPALVIARGDAEAIGLERRRRIIYLGDTGVHVRKRQGRKQAEATGIVATQGRPKFIP